MMGYLMVKMRICSAVFIVYRRVTDGHTDILSRQSPCYAYASRGKKNVCRDFYVDGIRLPRSKGMRRSTLGSEGQRSRSHERAYRFELLGVASFSTLCLE